jgi:hypothetical protein
MMRRMRRRWRARRYEAAVEPPFAGEEPPWATGGPDEWAQEWALPNVIDETPSPPGDPGPATPLDFRAAAAPEPEVPTPPPPPVPTIDMSAELVRVLEVVTTMCGHVIGFVEADREERRLMMQADREERRAMIEALSLLIARIGDQPAIPALPRERVIGGSMPAGPETVIDLRELETAREVCCRFGDQWLDGFEISEKVEDELGVRYRLRRRTDGAVLPELFSAADIRLADAFDAVNTFEGLTATAIKQGTWSPALTTQPDRVERTENGADGADRDDADSPATPR